MFSAMEFGHLEGEPQKLTMVINHLQVLGWSILQAWTHAEILQMLTTVTTDLCILLCVVYDELGGFDRFSPAKFLKWPYQQN